MERRVGSVWKEDRRGEEHLPKGSQVGEERLSPGLIEVGGKVINTEQGRDGMLFGEVFPLGQAECCNSRAELSLAGIARGRKAVDEDL